MVPVRLAFSNPPDINLLTLRRWFAYDTICQLSFGEPLGFVKEGRDIEHLIGNFHDMAPFAAVIGALPWLARPFLENPVTRRFAMPKLWRREWDWKDHGSMIGFSALRMNLGSEC